MVSPVPVVVMARTREYASAKVYRDRRSLKVGFDDDQLVTRAVRGNEANTDPRGSF